VAEVTALRNGLKVAVQVGFTDIHIEGDNRILIQAVKRKIQIPWKTQVLIQDITIFLDRFHKVIVNHIFRQGNSAVD